MTTLQVCEENTWPLEWDIRVFVLKQQGFKDACFCIFIVEHSFITPTDTRGSFRAFVSCPKLHNIKSQINGFGGLGVACWTLVLKFAGSNPAEAVGFFRAKKSSARLPSEGK
jgi:hypothetical protein